MSAEDRSREIDERLGNEQALPFVDDLLWIRTAFNIGPGFSRERLIRERYQVWLVIREKSQ